MLSETWLPIPGYESYQISSFGRVINSKGKILKPQPQNKYLRVGLDGDKWKIHQLVMLAFVGPCPDRQMVNHIDENKHNNRLDNLEYLTNKQNQLHPNRIWEEGIEPNSSNCKRDGWKLSIAQKEELFKLYQTTDISQRELAKIFHLSNGGVHKIIHQLS